MPTIAELVRARAADEHPAILFEDRSWSYAEYVTACAERAALLEDLRRPGPFHVGVLLDNVPEFAMWLGAAAGAGAGLAGLHPAPRGGSSSASTRPGGARSWPATSPTPSASCW